MTPPASVGTTCDLCDPNPLPGMGRGGGNLIGQKKEGWGRQCRHLSTYGTINGQRLWFSLDQITHDITAVICSANYTKSVKLADTDIVIIVIIVKTIAHSVRKLYS